MRSKRVARFLLSSLTLLTMLATAGFAQPKPFWVTGNEATKAFAQIQVANNKVLGVRFVVARPAKPDGVYSRVEALSQLHALYLASKPKFKFKPPPQNVDVARLEKGLPRTSWSQAKELVLMGLVAPVGPLIVGPNEGLTPEQFGDALGFAVARIAELTHTPSARWSPYLMRP